MGGFGCLRHSELPVFSFRVSQTVLFSVLPILRWLAVCVFWTSALEPLTKFWQSFEILACACETRCGLSEVSEVNSLCLCAVKQTGRTIIARLTILRSQYA